MLRVLEPLDPADLWPPVLEPLARIQQERTHHCITQLVDAVVVGFLFTIFEASPETVASDRHGKLS